MSQECKTVAEGNNFIILDRYEKIDQKSVGFQSEADLERELIKDLRELGYEYLPELKTWEQMLANLKTQIEALNKTRFNNAEWLRFLDWLDNPNEGFTERTRKIQENYICDFIFDDDRLQNIYLLDKEHLICNRLQVINQFEQTGIYANRYDVTILVNGLPLVQIELKKRGVAIREAFNQIHRYSKESFNSDASLFKFLQIFIISNGTDTRYFSNTNKRDKNSFDFTINWAGLDNYPIRDLKDFTATFLQKNTLLNVLLRYSVFDASATLLIMRPYQIAAAERILQKIASAFTDKNPKGRSKGGYVWHATGSGKTLTSFKAARMATRLPFVDKVVFVVDRKDLDAQTMREYEKFSPGSVSGSSNTKKLKENLHNVNDRLVVTTIQKLNNLMREDNLPAYRKKVVFIFDECHRSQFGEAQRHLNKKFKNFIQFGFTGTPIFSQNALGEATTESVFGPVLHTYVITDAIRDDKVLKFKVDYNDVRPKFRSAEKELDEAALAKADVRAALRHPGRIREIAGYVLDNFDRKTHRNKGGNGFNALLAADSIDSAMLYYKTFTELQKDRASPLKIATIFSFAANQEQDALGDIEEESFDIGSMRNPSHKEFLAAAIRDYNDMFKTAYAVESKSFENYYRELGERVKNREVDLLIVVGMFLTGFDAPRLNTLFVDKNLRYHGLIQAFSRTNRIYDSTKTFGNIVCFRDLEQPTKDAITLFGDSRISNNLVLERSFADYFNDFNDNGKKRRGFLDVMRELERKFPDPAAIERETDKKEFSLLFGEYMRLENILQNYDEFAALQDLQTVKGNDAPAFAAIRQKYGITEKLINVLKNIKLPCERQLQDYRSVYNDIREWRKAQEKGGENSGLDWDDVVFEVELLKTMEIDLDYILGQIFENHKKHMAHAELVDDARRLVRASLYNRGKENLVVDFINAANLDEIDSRDGLINGFYKYARKEMRREEQKLIADEGLQADMARRYIRISLKNEYASDLGMDLDNMLPPAPRFGEEGKKMIAKKKSILQKITQFIEKFKGIWQDGDTEE